MKRVLRFLCGPFESRSSVWIGLGLVFSVKPSLGAETWKIASLEWAPYLCDKACADSGGGGKALRQALKSVGVEVEYIFYPWSRAIREARAGRYHAFQTAWPEDCPSDFFFSETLYTSPFGIIERTSHPLPIRQIEDLKAYTVGVVQDYGNTKRFNELVRAGMIKTQVVTQEHLNLTMLANGRFEATVMDLVNFQHFMKTSHKSLKGKLQANAFVLEELPLGLCFPKNAASQARNETLKAALKKVDTRKIVADYVKDYFKALESR